MTVTVKLENGEVVKGELVREAKQKVADRTWRMKPESPTSYKGKQRQIVHNILRSEDKFWTLDEVEKEAKERGLEAVGGVRESCQYHLHNLSKLGLVEVQ